MKRGRKLGQTVNPRDERGWMVPRAGTIRRKIYDMMAAGRSGRYIWTKLGISPASYAMHRRGIVSATRVNAQRYNQLHEEKVFVPPSAEYQRGWNAAVEHSAEVAEHLNGWGSPRSPELADHIAKVIRSYALPPAHHQVTKDTEASQS